MSEFVQLFITFTFFLNTILRISWGQMIHQSRVYRKSTISNGKWEARPGAL